LAAQISAGAVSQLDWYRWRAQQLVNRLRALDQDHVTRGQARVVEVGSGPVGLVAFFPAAEAIAVDPLERFYATSSVLPRLRNPVVAYHEGVGEHLPCESSRYDLAIMENCIDHVQDMQAVLTELARVLKPGGLLYFTVNCRTPWGFVVHRALSRLRVDAGHPHTFTRRKARSFLESGPFRLLSLEADSYLQAAWRDLRTPGLRARLKALLGVSEFVVSTIAVRLEAGQAPSRGPGRR
jgi:SAM-dependent methyltransferase